MSFIFGDKDPYFEKSSTYECGFEPFSDTRGKFDVQFYLVAILFIIFDLEVIPIVFNIEPFLPIRIPF